MTLAEWQKRHPKVQTKREGPAILILADKKTLDGLWHLDDFVVSSKVNKGVILSKSGLRTPGYEKAVYKLLGLEE